MATDVNDVNLITDEDLLRRMWQQTDDFGKKKEIRAHMYKLREQRLKEFYTSGEVLEDVQRAGSPSTVKVNVSIGNKQRGQYHSDTLADQSFISLKSKEVRDSESPTRDVAYRTCQDLKSGDNAWTVVSKDERSDDGKTHFSTRIASTSGRRQVDDGVGQFAAIDEKQTFVHSDGNTSSVGGTAQTCVEEHFVSGDDNNYKQSSSKISSNRSKVVTTYSSNDGDDINFDANTYNTKLSARKLNDKLDTQRLLTSEIDNSNVKDFSDTYESTVKTSKNEVSKVDSNIRDNSRTDQHSSTRHTSSTVRKTYDETDNVASNVGKEGQLLSRTVKVYKAGDPDIPDFARNDTIKDGTTRIVTETTQLPDGSTVTKTKYETVGSKTYAVNADENISSSKRRTNDEKYTYRTSKRQTDDVSNVTNKQTVDEQSVTRTSKQYKDEKCVDERRDVNNRAIKVSEEIDINDKRSQQSARKSDDHSVNKTTIEVHKTVTKPSVTETNKSEIIISTNKEFTDVTNNKDVIIRDSEPYDSVSPKPKQKSTSSPDDRKSVDKDQYTTTYRQDYVNKRISVDLSPTHEAWAKTLRNSPEHQTAPRSRTNSPRTSPDKYVPRHSGEVSQKTYSVNNKFSSTETVTKEHVRKQRPSPSRYDREDESPERKFGSSRPQRTSPERKSPSPRNIDRKTSNSRDRYPQSPERKIVHDTPTRNSPSKTRDVPSSRQSPERNSTTYRDTYSSPRQSPERKVPTTRVSNRQSPERKSPKSRDSPPKQTTERHPQSPDRKTTPTRESPTKQFSNSRNTRPQNSPTRNTPDRESPDRKVPRTPDNITKTQNSTRTSDQKSTYRQKDSVVETHENFEKVPTRKPGDRQTPKNIVTDVEYISNEKDISNTSNTEEFCSTDKLTLKNQAKLTEVPDNVEIFDVSKDGKPTPNTDNREDKVKTISTDTITRKRQTPEKHIPSDAPENPEIITTETQHFSTDTITRKRKNLEKNITNESFPDNSIDQPSTDIEKTEKSIVRKTSGILKNAGNKVTQTITVEVDSKKDTPKPTTKRMYKPRKRSESRDSSPTSSASEIEYITHSNQLVTDLDTNITTVVSKVETTNSASVTKKDVPSNKEKPFEVSSSETPLDKPDIPKNEKRKSSLKKPKQSPERPVSSPCEEKPTDNTEVNPETKKAPLKEKPPFRRTETYEERCRKILGMPDKETLKNNVEKSFTELFDQVTDITSHNIVKKDKPESHLSETNDFIENERISSVDNTVRATSPTKIPVQKKSPNNSGERKSSLKKTIDQTYQTVQTTSILKMAVDDFIESESQKSDLKKPVSQEYPTEKNVPESDIDDEDKADKKPISKKPSLTEFPAQKRAPETSPERKITNKVEDSISITVSQTTKTTSKKPTQDVPTSENVDKKSFKENIRTEDSKTTSRKSIQEFPSQRRSPESSPERKYSTKPSEKSLKEEPKSAKPITKKPSLQEFPAQRRSPESSPERKYPRKSVDESKINTVISKKTSVQECSTEKQTSEKQKFIRSPESSPERKSPEKSFEKSPVDESKPRKPVTKKSSLQEFPAQKRTPNSSPERKKSTEIKTSKQIPNSVPRKQPSNINSEKKTLKKTLNQENKYKKTDDITDSDISSEGEENEDQPENEITRNGTISRTEHFETHTNIEDQNIESCTTNYRENVTVDDKVSTLMLIENEKATELVNIPRDTEVKTSPKKIPEKIPSDGKKRIPNKSPTKLDASPDRKPKSKPNTEFDTTIKKKHVVSTVVSLSPSNKQIPKKSEPEKSAKNSAIPSAQNAKPAAGKPAMSRRHTDDSIPQSKIKPTASTTKTYTTVKTTKVTQPVTIKVSIPTKTKQALIEKSQKMKSNVDNETDYEQETDIDTSETKLTKRTFTNDVKHTTKQQNHSSVTRVASKGKITVTNTTNEQVTKVATTSRGRPGDKIPRPISPTKSTSPLKKPNKKPENKHVSTKTITLTAKTTDVSTKSQDNVIIDITRSISSREPTPEKICPMPVDEYDEDLGKPRHPDLINEPDDDITRTKRRPTKLSDIPLTESETVNEFDSYSRITEIITEDHPQQIPRSTQITDVDKIQEGDECLLSVTEKVSKFLQNTTQNQPQVKESVIERRDFIVDENLQSDECLLSVSDKVTKFLTTAEQLAAPVSSIERPKSPRCMHYEPETTDLDTEVDLRSVNVADKVNRFTSVTDTKVESSHQRPDNIAPKVERPDLTGVDETLRNDECLLSVSDKVSKFTTTAQNLTTENKKMYKPEPKSSESEIKARPQSPNKQTRPENVYEKSNQLDEKVERNEYSSNVSEKITKFISTAEQLSSPSIIKKTPMKPEARKTDSRASSPTKSSPEITETPKKSTDKNPVKRLDSSFDSSSKLPKSSEVVRKAKALFENINKSQETTQKQKTVFSTRITEQPQELKKTYITNTATNKQKQSRVPDVVPKQEVSTTSDEEYQANVDEHVKRVNIMNRLADKKDSQLKSTQLILKTSKDVPVQETPCVKKYIEPLGENETPVDKRGYESERPSSPVKRTPTPNSTNEEMSKTTKFGVTLRRTDSGRTITVTERRKSSTSNEPHQPVIEDINDLDLLEQMLEKVVGYEQRRRIRAQIRIVRKQISDAKITSLQSKRVTTTTTNKKAPSPARDTKRLNSRDAIKPSNQINKNEAKSHNEFDNINTGINIVDENIVKEKTHSVWQSRTTKQDSQTRINGMDHKSTSVDKQSFNGTAKDKVPRRSPSPVKKARSPSPKHRTPSPTKDRRTPDYTAPTASWVSRTSTTTTHASTNKSETAKKSTPIPQSKPLEDGKPEWVTRNILRKTTTTTSTPQQKEAPIRRTLSDLKKKKDSEINKMQKAIPQQTEVTNCITSSYGVGPTDEKGRPLFGIKALRHQSSFNDKTQVKGTVITSSYYSENGQEPVGEVSVTRYSTDPTDLHRYVDEKDFRKNRGLAAITTTKKFGSNVKSIKSKESNDENEAMNSGKTLTSKVTRRGSVKEISQKFIHNATETSKSERQTTYPKAGLILRTSSFKDSQIDGISTRSSTPSGEIQNVSLDSMDSCSEAASGRQPGTAKSFLNQQTRVTGVQDVISRMKNADTESCVVGESNEDTEARALLNKFLGAQVLMTGMQDMVTEQSSAATFSRNERRAFVTTTSTSSRGSTFVTEDSGKNKSSNLVSKFKRPVSVQDLEDVWDEQVLRLLLDTSTSYEERRIIRARLRQLMAEQEACANIVASVVADTQRPGSSDKRDAGNTSAQGESLLLPLLKELLDKRPVPSQQYPVGATFSRGSDGSQDSVPTESVSVVEDSGTESGEDLRLLAAGLCDSIEQHNTRLSGTADSNQTEPLNSDLLADVLSVLTRLYTSLQQLDKKELVLDSSKRLSLLQLVQRLQTCLVPALVTQAPDKTENKPASSQRFSKRRHQRQNRHTVGVSTEELEDARRIMEDMVLRDTITSKNDKKESYDLQKQKSDGDVTNQESKYRPVQIEKVTTPVKNSVAKPFQSESSPVSVQQTPTDNATTFAYPEPKQTGFLREKSDVEHSYHPHSLSVDYTNSDSQYPIKPKRPLSESVSLDFSLGGKSTGITEQKKLDYVGQSFNTSAQTSEVDKTFQNGPLFNDERQINQSPKLSKEEPVNSAQRLLHIAQDMPKPLNRFNHKKLKMKRANTIDIPKPSNYYQLHGSDEESDSSIPDSKTMSQRSKSNYLALRGPIRVGNNLIKKSNVPSFEPKTDSDRKFLEFIKKFDNDSNNKVSNWSTSHFDSNKYPVRGHQNWNSAFGNIKTVFENTSDNSRSSSTGSNSAKKFWQSAITDDGSKNKNNKHGAKYLENLFEQKSSQTKLPWTTSSDEKNVITGSLKIDPKLKTAESITQKTSRFISQPAPVNKFSHAPMSAFKPPPKKIQQNIVFSQNNTINPPPWTQQPSSGTVKNIVQNEFETANTNKLPTTKQVGLIQPFQQHNQKPKQPVGTVAPWAWNGSEKRVLNIASKKFENPHAVREKTPPPKKLGREKVYVPPIIKETFTHPSYKVMENNHNEHLTAPQLVQQYQNNQHRSNEHQHAEYPKSYTYRHEPYNDSTQYNSSHFGPDNGQHHHQTNQQYGSENRYTPFQDNQQHVLKNQQYSMPQNQNYISDNQQYSAHQMNEQYSPSNQYNSQRYNQPYHQNNDFENRQLYHQDSRHYDSENQHNNFNSHHQNSHYYGSENRKTPINDLSIPVQKYYSPQQTEPNLEQSDTSRFPDNYYSNVVTQSYPNSEYQSRRTPYQNTDFIDYTPESVEQRPVPYLSPKLTNQTDMSSSPIQNSQHLFTHDDAKNTKYDSGYSPNSETAKHSKGVVANSIQDEKSPENVKPLKIFDYPSEAEEDEVSDLTSMSLTEYKAVAKVMKGPVSQQAQTVQRKSSRQCEEDEQAAKDLRSSLQKISTDKNKASKSNKKSNSECDNNKISKPQISEKPKSKTELASTKYSSDNKQFPSLNQQGLLYEEPKVTINAIKPSEMHDVDHDFAKSRVGASERFLEQDFNLQRHSNITDRSKKEEPMKTVVKDHYKDNEEMYKQPKMVQKKYHYDDSISKSMSPQIMTKAPQNVRRSSETDAYSSINPSMEYNAQCVVSSKNYYDNGTLKYYTPAALQQTVPIEKPKIAEKPKIVKDKPKIIYDSVTGRQLSTESIELNDQGEMVVTSKLQIPVVDKFLPHQYLHRSTESMSSTPPKIPSPVQIFNKSETWNQVVQQQQLQTPHKPPSPRGSPRTRHLLQKAKSSHTLAVPKQFEAGIPRDEVQTKKRTVEAYFSGNKSPQNLTKTSSQTSLSTTSQKSVSSNKKSSINRTKMSEKLSTQRNQGSALSRSQTMPQVIFTDLSLLDESNVDDAFENLFKEATS